jgi:hypothetical protein
MSLTRKIKKIFTGTNIHKNTHRPYERQVNIYLTHEEAFRSAGCVFTDGKLILAGYQPRKKRPFISGIGGKKEEGETYRLTALRETLEELFEFTAIPENLFDELMTITPDKIIQNGTYISVIYSFEDLHSFLRIISKSKLKTALYDSVPLTLMDLIFKRKLIAETPEISHLALLPLVKHDISTPYVDSFFIEDMPILLEKN